MSENEGSPPTPLGIYDKARKDRITAIEVTAIVLSVIWLVASGAYFIMAGPAISFDARGSTLHFLLTMLVVFMPVAMIWVAAMAARASRVMREESARLQAAIDAIRKSYIAEQRNRTATEEPSVNRKLDEIAAAQRKTETALATFSSTRRPAPMRSAPPPATAATDGEDQVDLPLGTPSEELGPPLERPDFIRALNFPETAEDKEGFAALRRALRDRPTAQLIRAAQDILTLMSHDGIYMDDLRPDMARPEIWRRFASGERGRTVAPLGGIRDRSSLALTAARMKNDPIFRDAAHHFLRRFDRMISEFAETATDTEITELSDTRTARAFMLLGRVTGTFS